VVTVDVKPGWKAGTKITFEGVSFCRLLCGHTLRLLRTYHHPAPASAYARVLSPFRFRNSSGQPRDTLQKGDQKYGETPQTIQFVIEEKPHPRFTRKVCNIP